MFKDAVVCYFMSYLLSLLFMIFEKGVIQQCLEVKNFSRQPKYGYRLVILERWNSREIL